MKVITWNARGGSASLHWAVLRDQTEADVLLLQEVHQPHPSANSLWREVPDYGWGSAVVVSTGRLQELPLPAFAGWVIGGEWLDASYDDGIRTFLFSVHAPSKRFLAEHKSYVRKSLAIVRGILNAIPRDCRLVIGGDFNFKSLGIRQPDERVSSTSAERKALKELAEFGLVPLWQEAHRGEALPQTLRWAKDPTIPYHCDGFLLRREVAGRSRCEVLTGAELEAESDHSPVAATISWDRQGAPGHLEGATT